MDPEENSERSQFDPAELNMVIVTQLNESGELENLSIHDERTTRQEKSSSDNVQQNNTEPLENEEEQLGDFAYYEDEVGIKEKETELTNKFLSGELTFSEYAALMEEQEACEIITDSSQPSTSTAEISVSVSPAEALERDLIDAGKIRGKRRKTKRRRTLPPALQGLMGEANLRYARGDRETAIKMCLEIIRQVPTAPEPFQTLAVLYEEMGDVEKSLQFALIAAHLNPHDTDQWIRLAVMSEEQGNLKQAITCYSKAINEDPCNVEMYMKRGELMERVGERKTSLRLFQNLLVKLPAEQGKVIIDLAKMLASKLHEDKELTRAKEAMDIAFKKVPNLISSEDVNLMLELLLDLKEYRNALVVLVQFCNLTVEAVTLEEESDPAEDGTPFYVIGVTISEALAIDLHAKLIIVLVHLKAFHLIDVLLSIIEQHNPDEAGDLYLDIAEALISEERHQDALRLLNPLVQSEKYSLAAVWLRQAECLKACGYLENAISSYEEVVQLAPQHLEARIALASLLNQLGQVEDALTVLSQDAESEVLEPGLLYEKCMLLRADPNRTEEFLAASQLLFSRHFVHIRNRDELYAVSRMRRLEKRKEALREVRISRGEPQQDVDIPDFGDCKDIPSVEQEWELFLHVCNIAYRTEKFALLQRFAFSAMGSKRFCCRQEYLRHMEFLSLLSCVYNNDAYYGYNLARDHLLRDLNSPRTWNIFNLVLQTADDVRHNRFLMRLLSRHPNNPSLMLLHANNCLVAGTYKYALSEYATAFRNNPSSLLAFLLGITLFQMACQKFTAKKHSLVTQGLAFFWKYCEMRGDGGKQEAHYNIGRAFHQLGLLPPAIYHYKEALHFTSPLVSKYSHLLDLKKEAAFNLYLIYMNVGARNIARSYVDKYIVL